MDTTYLDSWLASQVRLSAPLGSSRCSSASFLCSQPIGLVLVESASLTFLISIISLIA